MGGTLFFTSPIGLGHASRDAAVAELAGADLFVTGGLAARLLEGYGHAVEDSYEPPHFAVRDGRLVNRGRWLAAYYAYYRRCRGIAGRAMDRRKPDLVVSDEDFAAVAEAQKRGVRTALITDILESRFASGLAGIAERRMNAAMGRMVDGCERVIMPEHGNDGGNVARVGPIVRSVAASRGELRRKYNMRRSTVLVTAGGTGAGRFLLDAMKPVAARLEPRADTVVCGVPSLDGRLVRDLHEMVYAADAVVSLAGRSTMDEASVYGTPGVFIPISGHFEQEDNAGRVGCSHGDIDRLYDMVLERLGTRRGPPGAGGAPRAAAIIREMGGPAA